MQFNYSPNTSKKNLPNDDSQIPSDALVFYPSAQGNGGVSNRSKILMTNGYHGRVATYSEYQKKNTRKNSIEGLAFNCSLCGLHSDFSP